MNNKYLPTIKKNKSFDIRRSQWSGRGPGQEERVQSQQMFANVICLGLGVVCTLVIVVSDTDMIPTEIKSNYHIIRYHMKWF